MELEHHWADLGEFIEFPSPHGGSWSTAMVAGGFRPARGSRADVVVDVYGLMHDADQAAALLARREALTEDGTLVVQFPSYAATLRRRSQPSPPRPPLHRARLRHRRRAGSTISPRCAATGRGRGERAAP